MAAAQLVIHHTLLLVRQHVVGGRNLEPVRAGGTLLLRAQAPVGVAPGQEPGTEKQKAQETDEKSADLPTEIVAALSGDEQGKKRQAEEEEGIDEVEEDEELLESLAEASDDTSFGELMAQVEPAITAVGVRDVGTRFGRVQAARAYAVPE